VTGIKMARLKKLLSTIGEAVADEAVLIRTHDETLVLSYGFRLGLAVGIVFLMTVRPNLVLSVIALASATLVGVILAAGFSRMPDYATRNT
jgi:hypothetical protein